MGSISPFARAKRSLEGLSVGDAFGELFFSLYPNLTPNSKLPSGPWPWTDDTQMAISIVENLKEWGRIDQDSLAEAFARRYEKEPYRGYGGGASRLLSQIAAGADWREISPTLFGIGSYGNGAAMRAAPIGGYFMGDPVRAAQEAQLSAVITHSHLEGQAGAIAVAVAAAIASQESPPEGNEFLNNALAFIPESITRKRIRQAMEIPRDQLLDAARQLGTGCDISAQDTVPYCLWIAAHHGHDFKGALWSTVQGLGDCDTTCAIVGGIVAGSAREIPAVLLEGREPLPHL